MTLREFLQLLYFAVWEFSSGTTIGIYLFATGIVILYTLHRNNLTWKRLWFYAGYYLRLSVLICAPPVVYLQSIASVEPINLPLLMFTIGTLVAFGAVWLGQLGGMLILHSTVAQRLTFRIWLYQRVCGLADWLNPNGKPREEDEQVQNDRIKKLEETVSTLQAQHAAKA